MNFFRLKEWWRFRRAAKGRHGVHSPFVYRLIDKGLWSPLPEEMDATLREGSDSQYAYTRGKTIFRCRRFLQEENQKNECIVLSGIAEDFEQWAAALKQGACIIIADVHLDSRRRALWEKLRADDRVNLSIDLWYIGLLFCRNDFKEKQHFILKPQP
jgi:hypothetical protein